MAGKPKHSEPPRPPSPPKPPAQPVPRPVRESTRDNAPPPPENTNFKKVRE